MAGRIKDENRLGSRGAVRDRDEAGARCWEMLRNVRYRPRNQGRTMRVLR